MDGKKAIIQEDEPASGNLYRYLHVLVKYVFFQLPHSGWKDLKEAREAILWEFCPKNYIKALNGEQVITRHSTAGRSKKWMRDVIDKIVDWMQEQQMVIPDPEDFRRFTDSAPGADEEYPELQRLISAYKGVHNSLD